MPRQLVKRSLVLAFLVVTPFLAASSASAWQATVPGGNNTFWEAFAVAANANGHVVAAGSTPESAFFAIKVNRKHGHEIWRFALPGAVVGSARALALDAEGHAIVAGVTAGPSGERITVVKLDKELGTPHWISHIDGGFALAVRVDVAGDVIAAGTIGNGMGIVKLRGADGVELWRAQPSGAVPGGQVRALALDQVGNAVVAGTLRDASFRSSFAVVKLTGLDGSEQWRHVIPPHEFSGGDEALGVAVDAAGDAVALGSVRVFTGNALPSEFTVVKLAGADGALLWRRDVSPGAPSDDARALALDGAGDVIAVGSIEDAAGVHAAVVKLAGADGTEMWRTLSDGRALRLVAVDGAGDAIVGGGTFGATRADIDVQKVAGATGAEVWRTVINGPGNGDDQTQAVATDGAGDVLVAGGLSSVGSGGTDFAVIKLRGVDGADF